MRATVVIPTHNRRDFVREAVTSVLAQGGTDWETIVVDDGSEDGTAAALRNEFGSSVRVLQTPNRGVSAARNAGVRAGRGALLAFLDSDDVWLPGKLAAQFAYFADPAVQICQTQEIWMRDGVRVNPSRRDRKPSGHIFNECLHRCLVSASTVMMRRSLFERVGGFDESLPACEDYDLWLRIARNTEIHLVDHAYVVRRAGHADQLSRRFWGMDRFRVAALGRLLAADDLDPQHRAEASHVLAEKCAILAAGAARRERIAEADHYRTLARDHG